MKVQGLRGAALFSDIKAQYIAFTRRYFAFQCPLIAFLYGFAANPSDRFDPS